MTKGVLAAIGGYALGSVQVLVLDWFRSRAQHRRQLRFLRAELRRLGGFQKTFAWTPGTLPKDDTIPNPPRITTGYSRLIQEIDFWLTDEHKDDNTQQALIDISDGAAVLERYVNDVRAHANAAGESTTVEEKAKWGGRAVASAGAYDKEHQRWHIMVASALGDVERRISQARTFPQLLRTLRPMPIGVNPPPLPPATHS